MDLASQLELAAHELASRGMVKAARWASEAFCAMGAKSTPRMVAMAAPTTMRAKMYFDNHEYDRCWHLLSQPGNGGADPVAAFLRVYSRYLAGEFAKEAAEDTKFHAGTTGTKNPYLAELLRDVKDSTDAHLLYLKGVILRAQGQTDEAMQALTESLLKYEYNWSCWQELLACAAKIGDLQSFVERLETSVDSTMLKWFLLYRNQEFFLPVARSEGLLQELGKLFPTSAFLKVQEAIIYTHNLQYDEAEELFDAVIKNEPHRLDELDMYSNMLYVCEKRAKLSYLVQLAAKTDKFRAESCCIFANYYSLRGEHQRAITFYKRALVVSPKQLSAWTLLGHEYVELKNTHAAIECYRTAVDIDQHDFRAWYGLGQAYEVLDVYSYAQYYFQRALGLRPLDVRMWGALANCYERMGDPAQALSVYEQAIRISPHDPFLYHKLATLHEQQGDLAQAQRAMKQCVQCEDDDSEWIDSGLLWLAQRAMAAQDYAAAQSYAERISEGPHYDDGRAIARDALNRAE